jgi:flagellar motor switch protein FliM
VSLTAYLGEAKIKLSELRDLRPGDLIQLQKRVDRDLIVQIEGHNKFAGSVGQFRGRRAISLSRHAEIDEPL